MGKSLSIAAIAMTISTHYVYGYRVVPGKPIDEDYPLPSSLEQLRSKLVYRKTPLLKPSEIKAINLRQLQSDKQPLPSLARILNHNERISNQGYTKVKKFYAQLSEGDLKWAKLSFEGDQLSYNEFFTKLVQWLYTTLHSDKDEDDTPNHVVALLPKLNEIIFEMNGKKQRFEKVTTERRMNGDVRRHLSLDQQSFLYTLSSLSRKIMTLVKADGPKYYVYRYMWSYLQEKQESDKKYSKMLNWERGTQDYSESFGFVLYDEAFIGKGLSKWEFNNDKDTFEEFIAVLVDIDNWDNEKYEAQFNVPFLNDIAFKAAYLVKVLDDGDYRLNDGKYFNEKKIGRNEAIVLMAIQHVLIEWFNHQTSLTDNKFDRAVIRNKLSRELIKKDYAKRVGDTKVKRLKARFKAVVGKGTAPDRTVLDYFYKQ